MDIGAIIGKGKLRPTLDRILWISTGCGHLILFNITERGNGIGNSWLHLLDSSWVAHCKNGQEFQTFTSPWVTDSNIAEGANGKNMFQCVMTKTHTIRRALATHFPIPLPLSVILNNIKRPHPVEIQNTCTIRNPEREALNSLTLILNSKP